MKKIYWHCIALGCENTNLTEKLFFRLPKNADRRRLWLERLERLDILDTGETYLSHRKICRNHFKEGDYHIVRTRTTLKDRNVLPIPVEEEVVVYFISPNANRRIDEIMIKEEFEGEFDNNEASGSTSHFFKQDPDKSINGLEINLNDKIPGVCLKNEVDPEIKQSDYQVRNQYCTENEGMINQEFSFDDCIVVKNTEAKLININDIINKNDTETHNLADEGSHNFMQLQEEKIIDDHARFQDCNKNVGIIKQESSFDSWIDVKKIESHPTNFEDIINKNDMEN